MGLGRREGGAAGSPRAPTRRASGATWLSVLLVACLSGARGSSSSSSSQLQWLEVPVLSNPQPSAADVPPRLLSVVLAFAEPIATNNGAVFVTSSDGSGDFDVSCNGLLIAGTGRSAIVPLYGALQPDTSYTVEVTPACVLAADGSGRQLAGTGRVQVGTFSTVSSGSAGSGVGLVQEPALGGGTATPMVRPPLGDYVSPGHTPFSLQFSETVKRGQGTLRWYHTQFGDSVLHDELDMLTAPASRLYFDPMVPGRVVLATRPLQASGEYSLRWDEGAFVDATGASVAGSSDQLRFGDPYYVRVGSQLIAMYPREATLPRRHNVTTYTNLVLEFDKVVRPGPIFDDFATPGSSGVTLCESWIQGQGCDASRIYDVPKSGVFFLGHSVLLNPSVNFSYYKEYHLFVSGASFLFFSGIHLETATFGQWNFLTETSRRRGDTGPPVLVATRADCNADGQVDSNTTCSIEDGGPALTEAELAISSSPMLPTISRLFLYFREAIRATGASARLILLNGPANVAGGYDAGPALMNHSNGPYDPPDCVAAFYVPLIPGGDYEFRIGSNVITDRHGLGGAGVPYEGTSITFTTPLGRPAFVRPANKTSVNASVALQFTFAGYPEPAPGAVAADRTVGELVDDQGNVRTFQASDVDQVGFQGHHIRIAPEPALTPGRRYRFRLLHDSVRFLLADVLLEFDTSGNTSSAGEDNSTGSELTSLQYSLPGVGHPSPGHTDIGLYFSGLVLAASSPKLIYIVEEGDPNHHMIPVDNSDPYQGLVTAWGRTVRIKPRRDLSPGRQVEVHFRTGTFVDYSGRPLEGVGFYTSRPALRFRTLEPLLSRPRPNGSLSTCWLPPLEGAELHFLPGRQWLLLVGRRPDSCAPRAFTSALGETWAEVLETPLSVNATVPAYMPVVTGVLDGATTAIDKNGCVLLLGGSCSGAPSAILRRSCDDGLSWTSFPSPLSLPVNGSAAPTEPWPASFEHHALAVLGGWRLVVVDGVRRSVWSFLDASMTYAERHVPPWSARRDPLLASTGSGSLVLVGGMACGPSGLCGPGGGQLRDAWASDDHGQTWRCLSAAVPLAGTVGRGGLSRGPASMAAAADGALLLFDGLADQGAGAAQILHASSEPELVEDVREPPRLELRHPSANAEGVPVDGFRAILVFSSRVALGGAAPRPAVLTDLGNNSEVPVEVTTSGPVMTIVARSRLASGTLYRLEVMDEVLGSDARLAAAPGAWTFRTAAAEAADAPGAALSLQSVAPVAEDTSSPTHAWVTTRPVLLTFSHTIRLGSGGGVRFVGRSVGPTVHARPGEVAVGRLHAAGAVAVVVPEGLLPGEVYDVHLEAGTFESLAGTPCAASSWVISFAHLMHFLPVKDSRAALGIPGQRLASAFAVNDNNDALVVGGAEAVAGSAGSTLNDVWKLETGRHVDCASAEEEPQACSVRNCSGSPLSFGRALRRRLIWRKPSTGGRPCIDSSGASRSMVGQVIGERQETCLCPRCLAAPRAPLPEHTANATMDGFALLALADVDPRPLVCNDGFRPTGHFWCRVVNRYYGNWDSYPSCVPSDCMQVPQIPHMDLSVNTSECVDCPWTGDAEDCSAVFERSNATQANATDTNASLPVALHNSACAFGCVAGYRARGLLHCAYGRYNGSCAARPCPAPVAPVGASLQCEAAAPELWSRCNLQCHPGWNLTGDGYWECSPLGITEVGGDPSWHAAGQCFRKDCGPPPVAPFSRLLEATGVLLGARARFGCVPGYQLSFESDLEMRCEVADPQTGALNWTGAVICERRPCLGRPSAPLGSFTCSPDDGLTGDSCQLQCPAGFEVTGGNGAYVCDGDSYARNGTCTPQPCGRPPMVLNSVALAPDCPEPVRHGDQCNVVCRAAHTQVGSYHCHEGVFAQRPACIFTNGAVLPSHSTEATLTAEVRAEFYASSSALQAGVEASIDVALRAVGVQRPSSEVSVTATQQSGRRLDEVAQEDAYADSGVPGSARRMMSGDLHTRQNYTLRVSWRVSAPDNAAARDLVAALKGSDAFGNAFGRELARILFLKVHHYRLVNAVPVLQYRPPSTSSGSFRQDVATSSLMANLMIIFGSLLGTAVLVVPLFFFVFARRKGAKRRRLEEQEDEASTPGSQPQPVAVPIADATAGDAGAASGEGSPRAEAQSCTAEGGSANAEGGGAVSPEANPDVSLDNSNSSALVTV